MIAACCNSDWAEAKMEGDSDGNMGEGITEREVITISFDDINQYHQLTSFASLYSDHFKEQHVMVWQAGYETAQALAWCIEGREEM